MEEDEINYPELDEALMNELEEDLEDDLDLEMSSGLGDEWDDDEDGIDEIKLF